MVTYRHACLCTFLLAWPVAGYARSQPGGGLPLVNLVHELNVALLRVSDVTEQSGFPKLDSAELEVGASIKIDANGKVSLWVVELGGEGGGEFTSKVTLILVVRIKRMVPEGERKALLF